MSSRGGVISEVALSDRIVTGIIPLNFNITQYGIIKFDKLYKDSIFDNHSEAMLFFFQQYPENSY